MTRTAPLLITRNKIVRATVLLLATSAIIANCIFRPAKKNACFAQKRPQLTVLPALRGFGTTTPAGSGRHLLHPKTAIRKVTTLNDSGPGSLRDCADYAAPRTCVFEISGEIALRKAIRIRHPYITIAGQTAPGPGITLSHGGINVETHDVLIEHLAVRPGDFQQGVTPRSRDGVSIGSAPPHNAYNVVIDHLSIAWAIDENISTWHPSTHDVTIAHSIIAEGLYNSIHPKGPHSKGVMIGDGNSRITLYKNLIAFNEERNPYVKPGSAVEIINNVVYGWGSNGGWSLCNLTCNEDHCDPVLMSFIGNTYIPGPWSFVTAPVYSKRLAPGSRLYLHDNRFPSVASRLEEDWQATTLYASDTRADTPPLASFDQEAMSSETAYEEVLRNSGSRPFDRSATDRRIIEQVSRREGSLKDCITGCERQVGTWPTTAVTRRPLRIPRRPFGDRNRNGYTNLEEWLMRIQSSYNRVARYQSQKTAMPSAKDVDGL